MAFDPDAYLQDYADQYLGQDKKASPFDPESYLGQQGQQEPQVIQAPEDTAIDAFSPQPSYQQPVMPAEEYAGGEVSDPFTPAPVDPLAPEPVVQPAKPWRSTAEEARTPAEPFAGGWDATKAAVSGVPDLFKRQIGGLMEYAGTEDETRSPGQELIAAGLGLDVPKYVARAADYLFGTDTKGTGKQMFDEANKAIEENTPNLEPGSAPYYAYSALTAGLNMVPSIATTIATRNPNIGLAMMGSQVFGDKYSEAIASGRNESEATQDAMAYSLAETITEKIPLGILTKEGGKFLWRAGKAAAAEAIQEPVNEAIQIAYDSGVLDENTTAPEFWSRMKDAAIVGGLVGGGLATVSHPFVGGEKKIEDDTGVTGGDSMASDEMAGAPPAAGIDALNAEYEEVADVTSTERLVEEKQRNEMAFGPPEPAAEMGILDPVDQQYMDNIDAMLADPNASEADKEQALIMKANLARKSTQRRAEIEENTRVATEAWEGRSPLEAETPLEEMEGIDYDQQAAMDFLEGKETAPQVDNRSPLQQEQDARRRDQLKEERDALVAEEGMTPAKQARLNQIDQELEVIPPVAEDTAGFKPQVVEETAEEKEAQADIRNQAREEEQRTAKFEEEGKIPRAFNAQEQLTADSLDKVINNPDSTPEARKKAKQLKAQMLDNAAVPIDLDEDRLKEARTKVDELAEGFEKQKKEDKQLNKLRTKLQRENMALNKLRMQLELEDIAINRYNMNEQELADLSTDELLEFMDNNIRVQEEYEAPSPAEVEEALKPAPIEYENEALNDENVRIALQSYSEELVPGGGSMGTIVPDLSSGTEQATSDTGDMLYDYNDAPRTRLGSENPAWFQGLVVNNRKPTVKEIQTSVKKAVAGEKLGKRQAEIIDALVEKANEDIAEMGGFTAEAGAEFEEQQKQEMADLITAAEAVDPVATERALERQIPDEEVKQELRQIAASEPPPADEGGEGPPPAAPPGGEGPGGGETDLLGDDTAAAQAIADAEAAADEARNGTGEEVSLAQDENDLFANDGQLAPDLFDQAAEETAVEEAPVEEEIVEEPVQEEGAVYTITTPTQDGLVPAEGKKHLLIVACCDKKGETPGRAIELYEGAYFQMLKGNNKLPDEIEPDIIILSAKHGFISKDTIVDPYNKKMTKKLAEEMQEAPDLPSQLNEILGEGHQYDSILIAGGKLYKEAMSEVVPTLQNTYAKDPDFVATTAGGIGTQRKQLKEWFEEAGASQMMANAKAPVEEPAAKEPVEQPTEEPEGLKEFMAAVKTVTPGAEVPFMGGLETETVQLLQQNGEGFFIESSEDLQRWSDYLDITEEEVIENFKAWEKIEPDTYPVTRKLFEVEEPKPAAVAEEPEEPFVVDPKSRAGKLIAKIQPKVDKIMVKIDRGQTPRGRSYTEAEMKGFDEQVIPLKEEIERLTDEAYIEEADVPGMEQILDDSVKLHGVRYQADESPENRREWDYGFRWGYYDANNNIRLSETARRDRGYIFEWAYESGQASANADRRAAQRAEEDKEAAVTADSKAEDIGSITDEELSNLMDEVAPEAEPAVPTEPESVKSTNFGMLASMIQKNKDPLRIRKKFTSLNKPEMVEIAEKINPILHSSDQIRKSWTKPKIQEAIQNWAADYTLEQLSDPVNDGFYITFKMTPYVKENSLSSTLMTWDIHPLGRNSSLDVDRRVLPAIRDIAKYFGGSVEKKAKTYEGGKTEKGIHFQNFEQMAKFLEHYTGKTPLEFDGRQDYARSVQYQEDQETTQEEVPEQEETTPAPSAAAVPEEVEEGDQLEMAGKILEVRDYPEGSTAEVGAIEEDVVDGMMMASVDVTTPDGETFSDWLPVDWLVKKGQEPAPKAPAATEADERPAPKPAEKRADKKASDMLKEAAKQGIKGADEGLKGLAKLLGGSNRFNSGFSFDEETYEAAKPHFKSSLEAFVASGKSIKEFIKFILDNLGAAMKPYLAKFVSDIRANKVIVKGVNDAEREPTSETGAGEAGGVPGNEAVTEPAAAPVRPADETPVGQTEEEGIQQQRDSGLPDVGADAIGEEGDFNVTGEPAESIKRTGDNEQPGRGSGSGGEGVSVTREGSPTVDEFIQEADNLSDKTPTTNKVVIDNAENISATVPQLFPEQQDDVSFAEDRLFTQNKRGVLFTNGTGTGKTYTGLGIVARQAMDGKDNILITVPTADIARGWANSGKDLGLDISILKDTKDAGEGVVVTTYANMRKNDSLAKRDWDMVVHDEAHYLSSGAAGNPTSALNMSRALTGHKLGHTRYAEAMESDLLDEIKGLQDQLKDIQDNAASSADKNQAIVKIEQAIRSKQNLFDDKKKEHIANREELWEANTTKRVDLSATPFSYVKSVDMAEGFLFDYAVDDPNQTLSYNEPNGREQFFIEHFGYRMRTNKLTEPEVDVDSALMERQFNTWLRDTGAVSGRKLTVDHDYSREFIITENKIGNDMDTALVWLDEKSRNKDDPLKDAYKEIQDTINESMKFHEKVKLLEAIKAGDAVRRAKQHADLGRKVVIFHSRIQGGILNPFRLPKTGDPNWNAALEVFNEANETVVNADFNEMRPLDLFTEEFGDNMRQYNGTVGKKARQKSADDFNNDNGDVGIFVVQDDAGKEGISLHDNTGEHARVLINIGLPFKPTQSIQIEGRIFRVGQKSDAVFEYFTTDTDFERWTFAGTIAERSGTAENLSMGEEARALNDAFIEAYEYPNSDAPSLEQGTGGHAADQADYGDVTEFDRAKTYYFGNQKAKGKRNEREGVDYFATPEPLGLKMVEWADMQPNDTALEPSAGHGAIARFYPENVSGTFVEPSSSLLSRLALRTVGRYVQDEFESLDVGGNKFNAITMNPPYGSGGSTAAKHVYKAMQHLKNGGRIVALVPEGPAADKAFDVVLNGKEGEVDKLKETIKRKRKAGESVAAELAKIRLINNYHLVAEFGLPRTTFERAGTQVKSRIIVIDRYDNPQQQVPSQGRIDIDAENINDFFDNVEGKTVPDRAEVKKTNKEIVKDAGLDVTKEDQGTWIVDGNTYEHREMLRKVADSSNGGYNRREQNWFMYENPVDKMARALQGIPEPVEKAVDWRPLWKTPKDQEWKSTDASINKSKKPVTIGLVEKHYGGWNKGDVNADIGGGMYDNVIQYLGDKGVSNVIYDPFNRSQEFNNESIDKIKNGQADTATINNTLNVIKEPDIRNKILREAANSLKDGGTVYIQIYEGDKTGNGRHTKGDIWQENRPAKEYLEEVRTVFPDAEIKYGLITAKNTIIATKKGATTEGLFQPERAPAAQEGQAAAEIGGTPMEQAGLTIEMGETQAGKPVWIVKGNTKENKEAIKEAGGRWNRWEKGWKFYRDPVEKLNETLENQTKLSLRRLPSFYSELNRQTVALNQPSATVPQWRGIFRNMTQKGVKQAEIDWSGIDTWLSDIEEAGVQQKIPKEEILEYLKTQDVRISTIDRNQAGEADIKESLLRENVTLAEAEFEVGRGGLDTWLTENNDGTFNVYEESVDENNNFTKYDRENLRTPGNSTNYVEMELILDTPVDDAFTSSHYPEANVLVHVRGDERLINGKRTFYIDEIQSDWAQAGRESGYRGVKDEYNNMMDAKADLKQLEEDLRKKYDLPADAMVFKTPLQDAGATEEDIQTLEDAMTKVNTLVYAVEAGVPRQPFQKTDTWTLLGFKRALRHVSENGYDQIAWSPGEIQNDRYDLSQMVDYIEVRHNKNGYAVVAAKGDLDTYHEVGLSKADLENAVGKDLANRAEKETNGTEGKVTAQYQGEDLKINDLAMVGFYDKILPTTINKYVRKFGEKVGVGKLDIGRETNPGAIELRRKMVRARTHMMNLQAMPEYDEYAPSIYNEDPSRLTGKAREKFLADRKDEFDRWEAAVEEQTKVMTNYETELRALEKAGGATNKIDVWTVPVNEEMRRSAVNGQPMFYRKKNPINPPEAEYPVSTNQRDAKMLNSGLAKRSGYDEGWNEAFTQVNLPDSLKPFQAAIKAGFGRNVVGVMPNASRFNIIDGIYLPNNDGSLYVNTASDAGFIHIAGHELYHDLKRRNPELHEWMVGHLNNHVVNFAEYNARLNELSEADTFTISQAQEELLADFTGDSLADPSFLQQLAEDNPGKFKQLLNAVIKWLSALKRRITGLGSDRYIEDVEALRQQLRKAINIYANGGNLESLPVDLEFDQSWHGGASNHSAPEINLRLSLPTALTEPSASVQLAMDQAKPVIKDYWQNKFKNQYNRWWTKEGMAGDLVFKHKIRSDATKKVGEEEISAIMHDMKVAVRKGYDKDYKKLNDQELSDINAYLNGNDSIALPNEVKDMADVMRAHLDDLSSEIINSLEQLMLVRSNDLSPKAKADYSLALRTNGAQGKIPESLANTMVLNKTIEDNKGKYLHRSYAAFNDPKWMEKVLKDEEVISNARDLISEQNPKLTPNQVQGAVEGILQRAKDANDVVSFISKGVRYGTKDLSILKKKDNTIPEEILKLLGEYKNPFVNFAGSASSMQWLAANHKYLMALRQHGMGTLFYKEKEVNELGHYIKEIPDTERLNPLAGLYTTPEIDQGMIDLMDNYDGSDFMRKVIGYNAAVKYGKTILAPTTQARNLMSAFFFTVMNGHFNYSHVGKAGKVAWSDLVTKEQKWRDYLNELIGLGVLHDNPYSEELRLALKDANEAGVYTGSIFDKPKQFMKFMEKMYRFGDDFWKIVGFENELALQLKKGLAPDTARNIAAERIRDGYPTYSMINKTMKVLRRFPLVGAFVSFPYEIARTTLMNGRYLVQDVQDAAKGNAGAAEAASRRLLGMTMAIAGAQTLSWWTRVMLGLSDDDDEAVREHLPEWSRNSQLLYWGYDKDGLPIYIDASFADPYTYLKKPITALINGNNENIEDKVVDSATEVISPFVGWDIAAGAIKSIIANEKSTGAPIYNDLDSQMNKMLDGAAFFAKQTAPGIWSNLERTYKALNHEKSTSGREYDIRTELGAWVGIRSGVLNLHSSMVYKATGFVNDKRNAAGMLSQVAGARGDVDRGDLQSAFVRMNRARTGAYRDMIKYVQSSRKLQIPNRDIRKALLGGGMSQRDVGLVMRGKVPSWRMSKSFIKAATQKAYVSEPNISKRQQIRRDMRRRKREINQIAREARMENLRLNR